MTAEEIQARVLFRDGLVIVLDKPAGLPVHPGMGGGETLLPYLESLRFGLPNPPELAHRLDRDTSGCLALGRNRHALNTLGRLFAQGRATKTYWAVVRGRPPQTMGRIDLALAKRDPRRGWHMKVDPAGQAAVTDYRVLGQTEGHAWLELKPLTGRTHQLRVHCAALGCPILGDRIYGLGREEEAPWPLHLHARTLVLPLYPKREPLEATAPAPEHMRQALAALGWREE